MAKFLSYEGLKTVKTQIETWAKGLFVAKESGKGLSSNDYTTEEKQKLSGIANGAQANVLEGVKVNGVDQAVSAKKVNIDLTPYAKKTDISNVYTFKGSVNTYADLPKTNQKVGDTYDVKTADSAHGVKAGDNLSWNGTEWDNLGGKIDLSAYALKTELNNKVDKAPGKQLSSNDYTTEEKQKLAGLNNYTHPTADGNKHVPANGSTNGGKFLKATATPGIYEWANVDNVEAITNEEIEQLWTQAIG